MLNKWAKISDDLFISKMFSVKFLWHNYLKVHVKSKNPVNSIFYDFNNWYMIGNYSDNHEQCIMQNISSSIQIRQQLLTDKLLPLPSDTQLNHSKLTGLSLRKNNKWSIIDKFSASLVRTKSDLSERAL